MRIYLLLLGFIPVLALGLDLYMNDRAEQRDRQLASLAARSLKAALGPGQSAEIGTPRRIGETDEGLWLVQGEASLERAGQQERVSYRVAIAQLCPSVDDPACWQPRAASLGGQNLALGPAAPPTEDPAGDSTAPAGDIETAPQPRADRGFVTAIDAQGTTDRRDRGDASQTAPAAAAPSAGPAPEPKDTGDASDETKPVITATAPPQASSEEAAAPSPVVPSATQQPVQTPAPPPAAQPVEMSLEESLTWLIQERLSAVEEGTDLVPTGELDAATVAAIEAYRAKHGLPPGGNPTFDLLDHLDATLAAQDEQAEKSQTVTAAQPGEVLVPGARPAGGRPAEGGASGSPEHQEVPAAPSWDQAEAPQEPPPDLESRIAPAADAEPPPAEVPTTTPQEQQAAVEETGAAEKATPAPAPDSPSPAGDGLTPIPLTPQALATPAPSAEPAAPETGDPESDDTVDESLVFLIQDRLNRLGYGEPRPLALSGKLDKRTREAIVAYQQNNRLSQDGEPSEALLRHIEDQLIGQRSRPASETEP